MHEHDDSERPRPPVADPRTRQLLALQRSAGNHAVTRLLQREPIADWGTQKVLQKKQLPPFIQVFDKAIQDFRKTPPGLRADRKRLADDIFSLGRDVFTQQLAADPKLERFRRIVVDVAIAAKEQSSRLEQDIADYALAAQREQQSRRLPADIGQYAQHDVPKEPDVTPYLPHRFDAGPSYAHALAIPRGPGDELTAEGIAEMNAMTQAELWADVDASRGMEIDTGGKTPQEIKALMDAAKHPLSGETRFPELQNVVDQSEAPHEIIETVALGGVNVQVWYDENDATAGERAQMLDEAIKKIRQAGVNVPAIKAIFPRLARGLAVTGDCVVERGERKAAVFKAPDTVFLPEHVVANPKLEQAKADKPFFLSTALDSTGVATTVHELGHLLHYQHDPSGFHLLNEALHRGTLAEIRAIEAEVSEYASKNPREFVAEVFLGLVYGRTFSPAVMARYAGLRGMPVAAAPVPVAGPVPKLGTGKTVAYPSKAAKAYREAQDAGAGEPVLRPLRRAANGRRDADKARYREWEALLRPHPAGSVFDAHRLRIELPYNYQVVREQHIEFGRKLQEVAGEFFTDAERNMPEGGRYSEKDLAGKAFNDPEWIRRNERHARQLLIDARHEFAQFDYDTYDDLFGDATPQQLAADLAALPAQERIGHLTGTDPGNLIVAELHKDPRAKGMIVDNIDALVEQGVDALYIEHFRRSDYQALLDAYNQSAGSASPLPAPLAQLLENLDKVHNPTAVWPRNLKGVVEVAHRRGLKVMGMDATRAITKTGEGMERRAARMNFVAAEAVKADVARGEVTKFIMLVGEAHVHTHERGGEPQTVPGLAQLLGAQAVKPGDAGPELLTEREENRGSDD